MFIKLIEKRLEKSDNIFLEKEVRKMLNKICTFLTNKIRKNLPDVDEERAEVINFGLQNIIGEFPKIILVFVIAYILGIFKWTLFTFIALFIYKGASGGVHLKTHLGCILLTTAFYCLIPFISQYFELVGIAKYITILCVWILGIIMIKMYAPADTEAIPILETKVRKKKQIVSYISFTIGLLIALISNNQMIVNILILANFIQTLTITRIAYRLTNSKYGYEVYGDASA